MRNERRPPGRVRVGIRIRELRLEANLTQAALAKRAGTSQSAIARIERGDYDGHSLPMLGRIAAALNAELRVELSKGQAA